MNHKDIYEPLYKDLAESHLKRWLNTLPQQIEEIFNKNIPGKHGSLETWLETIAELPDITPSTVNLNSPQIEIGKSDIVDKKTMSELESKLRQFEPWRKGPYQLFSLDIDTEWRSDLKWDRLIDKIEPLEGRRVLDVGCGSGYHSWRMVGKGARLVIGLEPYLLYTMQFYAIRKYIFPALNNCCPLYILPLTFEQVPQNLQGFDTIFSMGVLYHRKSPFEHLIGLKSALRQGGQLVLETLIVDGAKGYSLVPDDRYAKMSNVWFIPTADTLNHWLQRCGFVDIELIDVAVTTSAEQRRTDWAKFESLNDFLDPKDNSKTIEGYQAPTRAVITAKRS